MKDILHEDTICALATGGSMSAIAVIRLSGNNSINIVNSIFSKKILDVKTHTVHFGTISKNNQVIDEVVVSIFRKNKSYTGEETVEISCHGSIFIQEQLLQLLVKNGCRMASPGEFTLRAFKNGKIDLSQAESVGDLIAAKSKFSHDIALNHLRGGFKNELKILRDELINFASLIELELDFSEEDVEFANRKQLSDLLNKIKKKLDKLITSFKLGNVIKHGVTVAIIGPPNVGKSTLLNTLINDEKAIVSDIPGTTRDTIEDEININGYTFRFIDTAGIRDTTDTIENLGIKKTLKQAKEALITLFLIDSNKNINKQLKDLYKVKQEIKGELIIVINKIDIKAINIDNYISISAKNKTGINTLKNRLVESISSSQFSSNETIITNLRHYEELQHTIHEINLVVDGLKSQITSELLAVNIKQALFHLGSITGEITTDTLLGNIFSKFCIGK